MICIIKGPFALPKIFLKTVTCPYILLIRIWLSILKARNQVEDSKELLPWASLPQLLIGKQSRLWMCWQNLQETKGTLNTFRHLLMLDLGHMSHWVSEKHCYQVTHFHEHSRSSRDEQSLGGSTLKPSAFNLCSDPNFICFLLRAYHGIVWFCGQKLEPRIP